MNEISAIYIIDTTGATIFSYEHHVQGLSSPNIALLSHFLSALKSTAKNLHSNEIKSIDISNNKFFLNREKKSSFLFILKSETNTTSKTIEPILQKIKEKFVEKYIKPTLLQIEDKIEVLDLFKEDIKDMLKHKSNNETFMENI